MAKSKHYLIKLCFDTNDGDYVYGSKIITQKEKKIIDDNPNKLVSFGSCDWGEQEEIVSSAFDDIIELTEEEVGILRKLGLDDFGELSSWDVEDILDAEDLDEDEEE